MDGVSLPPLQAPRDPATDNNASSRAVVAGQRINGGSAGVQAAQSAERPSLRAVYLR